MADNLRARDLFLAALDRPAAERGAFLDEACAGEVGLRQRVAALLQAHDDPGAFLSEAAGVPTGDTLRAAGDKPEATAAFAAETAGTVIAGKYTLVEAIGEGGMGSVWRAKQAEPVKRFVAVKLIKSGMDSKQVLARFEAERQALALMDHPSIAKVLDGGVHAGRPFFVMELVKGVPITNYCDAQKLTPRERLELFVPVCQAIQHAHAKGIIHRDIKPSNVLVALYDDRPVVKVIDFGVAKATGGALTEVTLDTGFGAIVGTPEYMSPEQATFNNLDIDTRSDVYALGALLYELLAGSPPFSRKVMERHGLLEILRVVREEEPPRPSTKLSTADALPSLSASRGTEPKKLTGLLRNELDWVVMKALEKDRARRYETANGLAADVLRYLGGEAVQAHPPSVAYRLRKYVRRHRTQVIAAALVLLALVAGMFGTSWGMWQANEAAEAARQAQEQAERNLDYAKKGNELLGSVFAGLHPKQIAESGRPLQDVLREKLGHAVRELEGSSLGDPLEVAVMQTTLGRSLLALGEFTMTTELLEKCLATRSALLGSEHHLTLEAMNNLATAYDAAGQLDKAVRMLLRALELMKAQLGPDHPSSLHCMVNLAKAYQGRGQRAKALPLLEEAVTVSRARHGLDHQDTLTFTNNLAYVYLDGGQAKEAERLLEEALNGPSEQFGRDHPTKLVMSGLLAHAYEALGQPGKGAVLLEKVLATQREKLGPDHPHTVSSTARIALAYQADGQHDRALPLLQEALNLTRAKFGADHPFTVSSVYNLATGFVMARRPHDALQLYDQAAAGIEARGFRHEHADHIIPNALRVLEEAGRQDRAEGLRKKWLAYLLQEGKGDTPAYASTLASWAAGLLRRKAWTEAEPILRECLAIQEKVEPDVWTTYYTKSMLGGALLGQKKYADCEPELIKGYEGMKAREKAIPPQAAARLPEALDRLIGLYTASNKSDEAKKWQAEKNKIMAEQAKQKEEQATKDAQKSEIKVPRSIEFKEVVTNRFP